MTFIIAFVAALGLGLMCLLALTLLDRRADRAEWDKLASLQPEEPELVHPELVADLPEPARRYFAFTIRPETPILPVAVIEMTGEFSLGTKEDPRYQPMEAREILAAPEGFVWEMRARGGMPVSGSDSGRWTRFRLFGLVPVARLGGNADHACSAFGRYVAESVLWPPSSPTAGTECSMGGRGRGYNQRRPHQGRGMRGRTRGRTF